MFTSFEIDCLFKFLYGLLQLTLLLSLFTSYWYKVHFIIIRFQKYCLLSSNAKVTEHMGNFIP